MEAIEQFLFSSSDCGYYYGEGDGYGYEDRSGDGSGSGAGYCSRYGDGDGTGTCPNGGFICSDGFGAGDGSGYGHKDGTGVGPSVVDGIRAYNNKKIYVIDTVPTIIEQIKGNYAKGFILNLDLTLTPCYIAKVGDYFAHGETLKQAFADAEAKFTQNQPIEDRVKLFKENFKNGVKYAAKDFFKWHSILTGSCEFGRLQFCKDHNIDINSDKFTVEEFINLTINAYKGEIIKKLL